MSWRHAAEVQCPVCGRQRPVLPEDAKNIRVCGYYCGGPAPPEIVHILTRMAAVIPYDKEKA